MITVYVWDFRGKAVAWGHASLLVRKTYVSWWPESEGRVASKVSNQLYDAYPIRDRKFEDDVRDESAEPDHSVSLEGLSEGAILDWWQSFGLSREGVQYAGAPLPWKTLTLNCSTVVATALKKAGGDRFAVQHVSLNPVWTPNNVLAYSLAIADGLKAARTKRRR